MPGRFHDTELPDWYREAERLSETDRMDLHRAFERVLDCEYTLLTEEGRWAARSRSGSGRAKSTASSC